MTTLAERLRHEIREQGPLRFDRFQAAALYDPDGGYYERGGRVGRGGDFVTGASWHPAFGRAVGRVAERLRDALPDLAVIDVGCGEGEMLSALPEGLRLLGVERSSTRRGAAVGRVPAATLVGSLEELPAGLSGLLVAYELFDALPVRALRLTVNGVVERRVGLDATGAFVFTDAPCPDGDAILESLAARGARLEAGQLFEIRPEARRVARLLSEKLTHGLVLVFDYGAPARALHGGARPNGTLEAFLGHQVTRDVLTEPGSRDITAWVDFTELEEELSAQGFQVRGLVSQSRFLLNAGIFDELPMDDPENPRSAAQALERNAIAKLLAPGGMGESIRVLLAERGTNVGQMLIRR